MLSEDDGYCVEAWPSQAQLPTDQRSWYPRWSLAQQPYAHKLLIAAKEANMKIIRSRELMTHSTKEKMKQFIFLGWPEMHTCCLRHVIQLSVITLQTNLEVYTSASSTIHILDAAFPRWNLSWQFVKKIDWWRTWQTWPAVYASKVGRRMLRDGRFPVNICRRPWISLKLHTLRVIKIQF